MRFLIAALFVGHGLVHGIMFSLPFSAPASADLPHNPSHSWLIGDTRTFGLVFALVVTVAFIVAGAAYFWRAGWWSGATLVAAGLSVVLLTLYFSRWWTADILISVVLAGAAWRALQVSKRPGGQAMTLAGEVVPGSSRRRQTLARLSARAALVTPQYSSIILVSSRQPTRTYQAGHHPVEMREDK